MLRYMSSGGLPCALGKCDEAKRGSGPQRGRAPVLPKLTLCALSDGAAQTGCCPKKPSDTVGEPVLVSCNHLPT